MFPTPRAIDGRPKGNGPRPDALTGAITYDEDGKRIMLPTPTASRWDGLQSHGVNMVTGQLNPTWVELLMGYPPGWTDLDD